MGNLWSRKDNLLFLMDWMGDRHGSRPTEDSH